MSVSNTTSKAGPYSANGAQILFPFGFKAFSKNDLRVVLTDGSGNESDLTVDSQFTVTLNPDQNASPGGSITTSATYATGYLITIVGNLTPNQLVNLTNFRPDVIEKAFDKLTLLVQQLFEQTSRSVKTSVSSTITADSLLASIRAAVSSSQASATAAGISETNALSSANAAGISAYNALQSYINARAIVGSVKVTAADTTASTLQAALLAGYGVSLTVQNPGANETLKIDTDPFAAFYKSDIQSVAFTKTGAGTAAIKAGTKVAVASTLQTFATDTAVVMPSLTAGTDYAIYVCTDGTIRADASFSAPTGYTTANSRQIGGFHYAPGGNAAAQAGGNTTPAINEYSIWDLKFRPACADPHGMALIAGSFWADIYLLGVDYLTNGSSKYNVSIADGSAPPKRSTLYGGNGTTTYADGNWWNLNEALKHVGKRSPTYSEFAAFAYGTTEATSSGGTDVPTTGVTGTGATSAWNLFTSKFGIIQASGCMWIWGDEFGGGAAAAGYVANTQGRGSTYQMENAVLLGGYWDGAADAGSRCSRWSGYATASTGFIGARGVCDHLTLV